MRCDIEVRGRDYVAEKGANFYLEPLGRVPSVSAHEKLEIALRWRDLGLFEPCEAELQARFPDVLREHALWLGNRKRGQRAQLCGRDLREVSWPKGALRGADLRGAILRNLDLEGDDLRGTDLRYADLTAARLTNCRLASAKLEGALLDFTLISVPYILRISDDPEGLWNVIDRGDGVKPVFNHKHKRVVRGDLSGCDMRGRILRHIKNASAFDFTDCDLRGADLSRLNCNNSSRIASFRGANLSGANVWGATFNRCDLTGANLENIQNSDSAQWDDNPPCNKDFRKADFRGADLNQRNFAGCDLSGADLRGANLCFANFSGAILRGANLRACKTVQLDLRDADLSGCDLRGLKFGHAKLEGARFDGARLDKDALNAR